jgi:hypothetical protein
MITKQSIPKSYKPFGRLMLCSNTIVGGGYIVSIGDVIPLLLGQGKKPMVWLQAVTDSKRDRFVTVVDASIAKHPAVRITNEGDALNVVSGSIVIIRIKSDEPGSAVVDKLDLRPLGINVFGDESHLQAGGAAFSSSTFTNVGTIIAFKQ